MEAVGIGKRLRESLDVKGISQVKLAADTGLSQNYLTNVIRRDQKGMNPETAALIATALGIDVTWFLTGNGKGPEGAGKEKPASGPRPKATETYGIFREQDFWYPDEVERLWATLTRLPGAPIFEPDEMRATKVFVRDATHLLGPGQTRLALMASAAEFARELTARGEKPTATGILRLSMEKGKPAYVRDIDEEEEDDEEMLAEKAKLQAEGHVAPRPARKPVDATPPAKSKKQ